MQKDEAIEAKRDIKTEIEIRIRCLTNEKQDMSHEIFACKLIGLTL